MKGRRTEDAFRFLTLFLFWASVNGMLSPKGVNFEVQALMGIKASLVDPHGVLDNWDGDSVDPCSWAMVTCSSENLVIGLGTPSQNLSGTLSPSIGNLTNLQIVLLQNNNITGPIPPELGRLSKLITLDLSNNFFTGEVPSSLGHLKSLQYMRINNNSLSGAIPLSLANITQLALLDLSFNNLSGPVPRFPAKTFNIVGNPLICGSEKDCYGTTLMPMSMPLNSSETGSPIERPKSHKVALALGLALGFICLLILGFGLLLQWRQRQNQQIFFDVKDRHHEEVSLGNLRRFQFRELQAATDNFSSKNILGKGGFGNVYRGYLRDGTAVAVKRLKDGSAVGGERQFQTEVEMISLAVHRNLLRLIRGFLHVERLEVRLSSNGLIIKLKNTPSWTGRSGVKGRESFASYESLEQLHRFLFVLGVTHVSYSFFAIALAMIKIYSWRTWENQVKSMAPQELQGSPQSASNHTKMRRLSTFIFHHTSHPWSQHRVLVWLLCFSRQFWSSINRADYMALRLGFITTHQLPLSYDFHNYMLRSMEEEFRDIVGISVPLWIFAILCVFLGFHGTNLYFWLSFLPATLILVIGTKLHRIVVKLAVEIMDTCPQTGGVHHHIKLRDELFWFGSPRLLLRFIQFISFQNAFEMAMFVWSLWETNQPSCFMENRSFIVVRLTFGLVSQFWCSFITFPLYVIVTQMGSKFKKSIVSESVRRSLHGWQRRVKSRHVGPSFALSKEKKSTTSLDSEQDEIDRVDSVPSIIGCEDISGSNQHVSIVQDSEISLSDEKHDPLCMGPSYDSYDDDSSDESDDCNGNNDAKDRSRLLQLP